MKKYTIKSIGYRRVNKREIEAIDLNDAQGIVLQQKNIEVFENGLGDKDVCNKCKKDCKDGYNICEICGKIFCDDCYKTYEAKCIDCNVRIQKLADLFPDHEVLIFADESEDTAYEDDCNIHVVRQHHRFCFSNGQGKGHYTERSIPRFEKLVDRKLRNNENLLS